MKKFILFFIIINSLCFAQSDSLTITLLNGAIYKFAPSEILEITFSGTAVGVEEQKLIENIVTSFTLHQNYPNPFNPSTNIMFEVPHYGSVEINIYDIQGQLVRSFEKTYETAGSHIVNWNGRDDSGSMVSSGTYFCRVNFNNTSLVKKLLLIK